MRAIAILLGLALSVWQSAAWPATAITKPWPQWDAFVARFVQADGRVIDLTFDRKSTSEGQGYALFFALVADDPPLFDKLVKWTSDNLAGGQLGDRLPAWLWGLREDGSWGVKDESSASDADLWIAYSLLEANRIWGTARYGVLGRKLLAEIVRREVVLVADTGPMLLPGPNGFTLSAGRFRIDPSYLPGFMFRDLGRVDPGGPWQAIWNHYLRLAPEVFRSGVAPDLFVLDSAGAVLPDSEAAPVGSYDAIRVYLWAGMSGESNHDLVRMLTRYDTLVRDQGTPPEKVNPGTGEALHSSYSPIGFSGAVLPFLSVLSDQASLDKQVARVHADAVRAQRGESTNYYDQVLILFGEGWLEGRIRFDANGEFEASGPR